MYKTIYPYMVTDIVSTGKTVFVVDKMERVVKLCNVMTVSDFFRLIAAADADKTNRFSFFTVDKKESEVGEDD